VFLFQSNVISFARSALECGGDSCRFRGRDSKRWLRHRTPKRLRRESKGGELLRATWPGRGEEAERRYDIGDEDSLLIGQIIVALFVIILAVAGVLIYRKRRAAQDAAHEARLRAMAQMYLVAARKKKAAEAAAAKVATSAAGIAATPVAPGLATSSRDERDCPFCAEPILKKAKVCKHCRRDVEPLAGW
jgi:hypothetical protein